MLAQILQDVVKNTIPNKKCQQSTTILLHKITLIIEAFWMSYKNFTCKNRIEIDFVLDLTDRPSPLINSKFIEKRIVLLNQLVRRKCPPGFFLYLCSLFITTLLKIRTRHKDKDYSSTFKMVFIFIHIYQNIVSRYFNWS